MSDIAKGITDCLDTINKLRDENTAQAARIAELEAALNQAKQHFRADEPLKAFVEICAALAGGEAVSDDVKRLWDARTWFKVAKMFEAQADRIAELKAALQKILNPHRPKMQGMPRRVIIQEIALMQQIARAALAGGKDE